LSANIDAGQLDDRRRLVIHQSLIRPSLLMGAERNLVLLSAGLTALTTATGRVPVMLIGLVFWVCSVWVLRRCAKIDPSLSDVITRHFNYQKFYPAQPMFTAPSPRPRTHQHR